MGVFEEVKNPRLLAGQYIWFGIWVLATVVALWLRPSPEGHGTHTQLGLYTCPAVQLFDRPCPGCGLTTSWACIVKGRVAEAFHAHALGPILYLLFTGFAVGGLILALRRVRVVAGAAVNWTITACFAVFFLYGIVRFFAMTYHSRDFIGWKPPAARQASPSPQR